VGVFLFSARGAGANRGGGAQGGRIILPKQYIGIVPYQYAHAI
jgi:hypothetical protein